MHLLLALTTAAFAAWPEDVNIAGMTDQGGIPQVNTAVLAEDYKQIIKELGVAVGSRVALPANTLGARGFELSLDSTFNFHIFNGAEEGVSPWSRVHTAEDPGQFLYQPGLTVRKGLPFSIEVGMGGRWIGQSRQGVVTGFARVALVEGYHPYPDVTVHIGGSGYVGNAQLEMGVFDAGITLGTRAALGPAKGAKATALSPFVDVTLMVISSAPKIDAATRAQIGAMAYGNRDTDTDPTNNAKAIAVPSFNGGLQFDAGALIFRVTGGYALNAAPWAGASVGFHY